MHKVKPIFGKLPQELYREIYDYDNTYRNVFSHPKFLTEIENMLIQIKHPVQYHLVQELIKKLNGVGESKTLNLRSRKVNCNKRAPVDYKIHRMFKSNTPTLTHFTISTRGINNEYQYDPNKYYGCICDPTKIVYPNFHTQSYLNMKIKIKVPKISNNLILYTKKC